MAFVRYDESLYRTGHRMFGLTDPFTASHGLSGINHSYGGFGPWMLHGGDQPFTERGGETLRGLGEAPIPDGSIIVYRGTWTSVFNTGQGYKQMGDPQSIVDGVVAALNADGELTVLQQPQGLSSGWGAITGALGVTKPFQVTLTLQVTNGQGFQSVNDPISIINHYVYAVSGLMPQWSTVTSVRPPSAAPGSTPGSTTPNYQAAGIDPVTGLPYTGICDFGDCPGAQPTDFATWFQNNAVWIGLGIGALVLLPKVL
jgi:hypothetical protein